MLRVLVAMAILLTALASVQAAVDKVPVKANKDAMNTVVHGNSAFAVDLYRRLADKDGNLFFSPYSISTALAMTYAGAAGQTAEEMAKTLHFPADRRQLNEAFAKLVRDLNAADGDRLILHVANGIWGQSGYPFLQKFRDVLRTDFGGQFDALNFAQDPDGSRQTVNRWIEEKTNDKIKNILPPGSIIPNTRLVLANAIYFKAQWLHPFYSGSTKEADFHLAGGSTIKVPLMTRQDHFKYMERDTFQALELPYQGGKQSMVLFLPKKADGLAEFEKGLSAEALAGWLNNLKDAYVRMHLPKFRTHADMDLSGTLSAMGMPLAFSQKADFSGMDGRQDLYLSLVRHAAYVNVDEKGTEAAGATVAVAGIRSVPQKVLDFRADHPFFYAIRDVETGSILFMGRLAKP